MEEESTLKYARSEKSLSTLTRKFVELLKTDLEVDLNVATLALEVTKKRRIYDITNVLEGINLIRKTNKNTFTWSGKINAGEGIDEEAGYLEELQADKVQLTKEEKQLDSDIATMTSINEAFESSKSFLYVTKNDFLKAFSQQKTVMIVKDYKKIRFNFNGKNDSLLLNSHKQATVRDVQIVGDVLRPAQLKLVNSLTKQGSDPNLLFCLDDMASDDEDTDENKSAKAKVNPKQKPCAIGQTLNINLFRRRLKMKKFLELEESEREQLATSVMSNDRFKDKSLFYFIKEKQLVLPSDYEEPDFITLCKPSDTEYEQSYSQDAPSIHDLFDIAIDIPPTLADDEDYEMMEFLDDDEDS